MRMRISTRQPVGGVVQEAQPRGLDRGNTPMAEMSDDGIQLAQVIRELNDHIGINWKAVARELEFTTTDVDAIVCRDEHDLKEQIHRFFEQWKMREGSGASVQKLIEAVRAAGLRTILDDLQRALPELECGGIMPVQETAPTGGTPTSERDLVRMKRLQKMSISDDPSFQPSSSPGGPRRSASSQTAAKNSEPSPIKAGVSSSFEVGQVVKVDHKPKPWYGVIKYIGPVTDCPGTFAGVEMDEVVEGGHAGKFGGKRYFTCNDGYGLMLPRSRLNLDDRFDPPTLKGGSVGGDDVERDKNMPSTPTQPTASRKPSDPLSPDLMKGDAAKPTQKEMPGVFESTDSPETSGGGEVRLLAFECAGDVAGFVIGRDGKNRRDVESKTDTRIRVEKKEGDTAANTRVIIMGKKENCQKALLLIVQNLRRKTALHTATTETIDIPSQHCGRVIGRKGANVRAIENLTGTRINIEQPKGLDVFLNFEAVAKCKITGSAEQIEKAKEMVRKSVEGSDIAGAAFIAAFMLKFMKEIKAEGHNFDIPVGMTDESPVAMTDERAQQIIDKAMESGSLQQRNVVGVITGLMGAGKTTLLFYLFGLAPPDLYTSTGVTERSFRGLLRHIMHLAGGTWKRLSYENIREFLAPLIQAGMKEDNVHHLAVSIMHAMNPVDTSTLPSSSSSEEEAVAESVTSAPTTLQESPSCQKMIPLVKSATRVDPSLVLELVHMIDTGGQPELMEVMPSLVHNANLGIVVVSLECGLYEHPEVHCHEKGKRYPRRLSSQYSERDVILKLASTFKVKKYSQEAFRLLIVATHRDCVKGNLQTRAIEVLNRELRSILLPTFKDELILFKSPDKIAYVLNLKNPDDDDRKVLNLIREKVGKPDFGKTFATPTSFFIFEQDLIQFAKTDKKRDILTLEECKLVGAKLKMSDEMVGAALVLLHRQNTFLYFRDILPGHVFINPQVPLDIVNEIVHFKYKVNNGEFDNFPMKLVTQLNNGIVTEELLSYGKISPHFQKGIYEVKDAIKLFCHNFTLAPLYPKIPVDNKKLEYLMMCLKPAIPEQELHNYFPKTPHTVPLVVKFSTGCVPLGCFGSTTSCLLSTYGMQVITKSGVPKCLAHNIASLHDPEPVVDIVLVDFTQHLEVHIISDVRIHSSAANICREVRRKVLGAVQIVIERMQLDIEVIPAVVCTCTNAKHFAEFGNKCLLRCCLESTTSKPDAKQLLWMNEDANSKPDLPEMIRLKIPEKVGAKYTSFGTLLLNDTTGALVEAIETECNFQTNPIVLKILRCWLRSEPTPVTWQNIIKVLEQSDLHSLADDIIKVHAQYITTY